MFRPVQICFNALCIKLSTFSTLSTIFKDLFVQTDLTVFTGNPRNLERVETTRVRASRLLRGNDYRTRIRVFFTPLVAK